MPAIFTDEKRERIFDSMVESGIELFGLYGVKKTTVEELAVKSSIAKGSFYKFFPSKEHLLLHCFLRIREKIAEELTSEIVQTSGSPEDSIQRLLHASSILPDSYPIIKEFYSIETQNILMQIAAELHIEKREFTPVPNFVTVVSYWRYQGFVIDAKPHDLEKAAEIFSSHAAAFGFEEYKSGRDLLIEFASIGSTGFISENVHISSNN